MRVIEYRCTDHDLEQVRALNLLEKIEFYDRIVASLPPVVSIETIADLERVVESMLGCQEPEIEEVRKKCLNVLCSSPANK